MKKKILIYAHYYVPDVASTGQILRELAEGMVDKFDVTVLCVVPSYTGIVEKDYKKKKYYVEKINGINVIRIPVPEFNKNNKVSRIKNILAYYLGARKATRMLRHRHYDYVFAISQPPLIGGLLGSYGKKILRTVNGKHPAFIYNIQDLNPEQIMAVGYFNNKIALKMMMAIDKHSCRKSDLVITVGRDLVENLKKRFKRGKIPNITMINNWVDEQEIYPLSINNKGVIGFKKEYGLEGKYVFMYSGNIGLYYDLENLIKICKRFEGVKTPDGRDVVFAFVGAGSVLDQLIEYVEKNHLTNVKFIPYQEKEKLIYSLNAGDVHWCVNSKGIKGVSCPSKYYGLAAVGKPILGVLEEKSEIRMLIEETGGGLVCEPGDYKTVETNVGWFIENANSEAVANMGRNSRKNLTDRLTKSISIMKYKKSIIKLK